MMTTTTSRREPLSPALNVRGARDSYLAENGFTVEGYDAKWTQASFFGVPFRVPNTKRHSDAIKLHDLHHVATGYGTDLVGEGEISAWEFQRGVRALGLYVGSIVTAGLAAGLILAPRRTLAAWRAARGDASLFHSKTSYESLLAMSVGELRDALGVPRHGVATAPRALHAFAPGAARAQANG
jgi:hypothetical protein